MADQIAVVKITTPDLSSPVPRTLDITDPSITEPFSAAILIFTKETSDGTDNAHGMLGIGFIGIDGTSGTATQQVAIALQSENGVASAQNQTTIRSPANSVRVSSGVDSLPVVIVAELVSAIPGGVQLSFTTIGAGPIQTTMTVVLFAGLSFAITEACTFNDVSASHEGTSAGATAFEPDLLIHRSSDNVTNGETENGTLALGFATNTSPIQQVSHYINWDELIATTDSDGYIRSDCCSSAFISGSGVRQVMMDRFQVTSFDSTGWNAIAFDTGVINSPQSNYLALKFSGNFQIACLNLAIAGSAGDQDFNGFGFDPTLIIGMVTPMTTIDSIVDGATASAGGYFVTGALGSRAYTVHNQENRTLGGGTPSNAHTRQEDVALLLYEHIGTIIMRATWVGNTGDGFTLNFSTASQAGTMTVLGIKLGATIKEVSEDLDLTETTNRAVRRAQSDTLAISETVDRRIQRLHEASDTLEVQESLNIAAFRALEEALSLAETINLALRRSILEELDLTETVGLMHGKEASDVLTISETVEFTILPRTFPEEPVEATDTGLAGAAQRDLASGGAVAGDDAGASPP